MITGENSQSSEPARLLKRRSYPSIIRLPIEADINLVREELATLEKINGWNDMDHGSPLTENLLVNRSHLASCFQDEDGNYSKYRQIILTDRDPEKMGISGIERFKTQTGHARYKHDVSLKNQMSDEGKYNAPRSFLNKTPYIRQLLKQFGESLMRARFAKIRPNFSIQPHIDYDLDYGIRLHLGIYTNEKSNIYIKRSGEDQFEKYQIPVDGHFYFVNTGFSHYAENFGDTDRTHLVLSLHGQETIWPHRIQN